MPPRVTRWQKRWGSGVLPQRGRSATQPHADILPNWRGEALLLVAHGATHYPDAARPVQQHAAALRGQRCFAEVGVGLLNGTPAVADALAALTSHVVHVVPVFMEQGWFVREAVPRALGTGGGHVLRFHEPVGVHPGMARLVAARVQRACGRDAPRFTVLLAGHGSARAPGRPLALHRHVAALAAEGRFAAVCAAFLEEPPLVADALRMLCASPVAVVGCFAGEGGHVRDDLPALLAAEQAQRGASGAPLLDLGSIGDDPAMPDLILELLSNETGSKP